MSRQIYNDEFAKHDPMIFKIGYTHNAVWRWCNNLYGYKFDKIHKWERMVILYKSNEPFGPAMLEASLIDMFQSILPYSFGNFDGSP